MLDYLFFFSLESNQGGIIPAQHAAECFINFVLHHSAQESPQVQSTTQLSPLFLSVAEAKAQIPA